jgi:hypothetical protein
LEREICVPELSTGAPTTFLLISKSAHNTPTHIQEQTLTLEIPPDELEHRRAAWALPPHVQEEFAGRRGVFRKYTQSVRSAHVGAVTY